MSLDYILMSLVVVLLPGAGVLYTLAIGLGRGFVPGVAAALGCTLGIIPAALASIVGLATVFHSSAIAFQTIKYLGVIYLFYMAWKVLRDDQIFDVSEDRSNSSFLKIATDGMLLNILNPKLSLFFLAFLPQFLPSGSESPTSVLLILTAVFMLLTFIIFVVYGSAAAFLRRHIVRKPSLVSWFKRVFAGTFGLLGLKLALAEK